MVPGPGTPQEGATDGAQHDGAGRNTTEPGHSKKEPEPEHCNRSSSQERRSHSFPSELRNRSPCGGDGDDRIRHIHSRSHNHHRGGGHKHCPDRRPGERLRPRRPESTSYETSAISSTCGTLETRTP